MSLSHTEKKQILSFEKVEETHKPKSSDFTSIPLPPRVFAPSVRSTGDIKDKSNYAQHGMKGPWT